MFKSQVLYIFAPEKKYQTKVCLAICYSGLLVSHSMPCSKQNKGGKIKKIRIQNTAVLWNKSPTFQPNVKSILNYSKKLPWQHWPAPPLNPDQRYFFMASFSNSHVKRVISTTVFMRIHIDVTLWIKIAIVCIMNHIFVVLAPCVWHESKVSFALS